MKRRLATVAGALATGIVGVVVADRWLARQATDDSPVFATIRTVASADAPPEIAWGVLSDLEGQVRWMHDAKAIRILTPGPVGVGTRAEADVRIMGLGSTDPIEVIAWDPPARFAIRHLGGFTGEGEFRLERAGPSRTIVTWTERLVPPVLSHLAAAALYPVLSRVFRADLDRFVALVEEAARAGDGEVGPGG